MTYVEIIALSDSEEKPFDDSESNAIFFPPSTPTSISTKGAEMKSSIRQASTVHTINVNYHHCYSLKRKASDLIDIPELLETLVQHTQLQSPSRTLPSSFLQTQVIEIDLLKSKI